MTGSQLPPELALYSDKGHPISFEVTHSMANLRGEELHQSLIVDGLPCQQRILEVLLDGVR